MSKNFEKEYKESIGRAKKILGNCDKPIDTNVKEAIEAIFPILKKGKPVISREVIREGVAHFGITQYQIDNWLKKHFDIIDQDPCMEMKLNEQEKVNCGAGLEFHKGDWVVKDNVIAWLEKQGEQNLADNVKPKFKVGDIIINRHHRWDAKNRIREITDGKYIFDDRSYINIKEQDSWELANKVEPKFKAGNWYQCTKDFFGKGVTFDKNTAYYCAKEGCLQNEYGCHIAIVKDLYDNFKLWTIADARDGDILASDVIESLPSPFVAIYKRQDGELFETYCFIGHDGKFYKGEIGHASEYVHPATKEQRSTLKKAMTDAGCIFDFEKKELKKLGQPEVTKTSDQEKYSIPSLKDFQEAFELKARQYDIELPNRGYDIHAMCKELYSFLIKRNPAWSEDDEYMLDETIQHLKQLIRIDKAKHCACDVQYYQRDIDWLKSLRHHKQWKPSEEQMDALETAVSSIQSNTLETLYQDLKREKNYE